MTPQCKPNQEAADSKQPKEDCVCAFYLLWFVEEKQMHMHTGALRDQERESGALELELQVVVTH